MEAAPLLAPSSPMEDRTVQFQPFMLDTSETKYVLNVWFAFIVMVIGFDDELVPSTEKFPKVSKESGVAKIIIFVPVLYHPEVTFTIPFCGGITVR
jgi:hypothetical protein